MNKTVYFVAAICFAGLLLITAPASLLDLPIRRISHDRMSLANTQGTIWHGSATPVLHTGQHAAIALHALNWEVEPQSLLRGQFKVITTSDDTASATPMVLTIDRKGVALTNLMLLLPAELIGELSPFLKPAQLSGNLRIDSTQLTFADNHLQGKATVRWDQAGSAMSTVHPLGDYQIDIVATQDRLDAVLSTRGGSLLLNGQGSWSLAQKFHFNGTAQATPETREMLSELLQHLGPETAPGVYQISL